MSSIAVSQGDCKSDRILPSYICISPLHYGKKINAVNVLDFTTLNHRSSIPLLTIYKTTCDSSRRLTKYGNGAVGTQGKWILRDASSVKFIAVRVQENVLFSSALNRCFISLGKEREIERESILYCINKMINGLIDVRFSKRIIYLFDSDYFLQLLILCQKICVHT